MQVLSLIPLSGILLLFAGGLMTWHVHGWRAAQQSGLDPHEREYRGRQFRRRVFTTSLMGLVAIALPFTVPIMESWPKAGAAYVILILLVLVLIGLLALADVFSIKLFYSRLRVQQQLEQARLAGELRRIEAARKNGSGSVYAKPNGNGVMGREPETES